MIPPSFTKLDAGASTVEFTEKRRGTMQDTVILQSVALLERTPPFFKRHAMTNTHIGSYLTYEEIPCPRIFLSYRAPDHLDSKELI